MDVGFVGLGVMGQPMAANLIAAGHRLIAFSRSGVPAGLKDRGAVEKLSARAVAETAEVIIMMLPDTPDVEAVLFVADGIASGLAPGKLVIDMSSISPTATRIFAERIAALGCGYLDAPVSGGQVGATNGTLSIMVGGDAAAFMRAKPLFDAMGTNVTLIGGSGNGQIAKIANQIVVALTIEAVAEALVFASKAGADPAPVRSALLGGFAASRVLEVHGERMLKRTFTPGFRIALHQKDLRLALEAAHEVRCPLPNTAACQTLFNVCAAAGDAELDHSGLVKAIELMANHPLGS